MVPFLKFGVPMLILVLNLASGDSTGNTIIPAANGKLTLNYPLAFLSTPNVDILEINCHKNCANLLSNYFCSNIWPCCRLCKSGIELFEM